MQPIRDSSEGNAMCQSVPSEQWCTPNRREPAALHLPELLFTIRQLHCRFPVRLERWKYLTSHERHQRNHHQWQLDLLRNDVHLGHNGHNEQRVAVHPGRQQRGTIHTHLHTGQPMQGHHQHLRIDLMSVLCSDRRHSAFLRPLHEKRHRLH